MIYCWWPYPPTDHWKESIGVSQDPMFEIHIPKMAICWYIGTPFLDKSSWEMKYDEITMFDEEIPGFDAFPLEIHRLEDITDITPPRGPASRQSQPPRLTPYMPCCWMMPFTCVDEVKLHETSVGSQYHDLVVFRALSHPRTICWGSLSSHLGWKLKVGNHTPILVYSGNWQLEEITLSVPIKPVGLVSNPLGPIAKRWPKSVIKRGNVM